MLIGGTPQTPSIDVNRYGMRRKSGAHVLRMRSTAAVCQFL